MGFHIVIRDHLNAFCSHTIIMCRELYNYCGLGLVKISRLFLAKWSLKCSTCRNWYKNRHGARFVDFYRNAPCQKNRKCVDFIPRSIGISISWQLIRYCSLLNGIQNIDFVKRVNNNITRLQIDIMFIQKNESINWLD